MPSVSACRVDMALRIIGDRWSLGIIHELSLGPRRTLELHGSFARLSTKTLAERLKRLERNGIITRVSFPQSPPRVEYSLTDAGRQLLPILTAVWNISPLHGAAESEPDPARSCRACRLIQAEVENSSAVQKPPPREEPAERIVEVAIGSKRRRKTDVTLL